MKGIISKLKKKKDSDPAHFSKKQKEEREKKLVKEAQNELDKEEKEQKKLIIFLKKELTKYSKDTIDLLKINNAINERFKVSSTSTRAADYGVASVYFNALQIEKIPRDYYPKISNDAPDFFITPSDGHYYLWNFQINTQDQDYGHSIPDRPGKMKQYVIHGFLLPMTSTVIYLTKWESSHPGNEFLVNYSPNDTLFGDERDSVGNDKLFDNYKEALEYLYNIIDKHLDNVEEKYYNSKQDIS